jgi:hypothetical protein
VLQLPASPTRKVAEVDARASVNNELAVPERVVR